MNLSKIFFEQDAQPISIELAERFDLGVREQRYSNLHRSNVLNFVGIVIKNEEMLISLPKHYADTKEAQAMLGDEDIELLFKILIKNQKQNTETFIGDQKDFESTYPFASFFMIYTYFKKYGLYTEISIRTRVGYNGKILWKDTIRKSENVISNGNLVYLPLFIAEIKNQQVFLSECMAFVINHTLDMFPIFIKGQRVNFRTKNFDFFDNKEYVIGRLRDINSKIFKDIHKKLVRNLIDFFENISRGGDICIRHYNFELIWEDVVAKILNQHFEGVSEDGSELKLSKTPVINIYNFSKKSFKIDKNQRYRIEPDHYFIFDNVQFILDSKYYESVNSLNYKQVSYYYFLKNECKKTINGLIIPKTLRGEKFTEGKFHLDPDLRFVSKENEESGRIIEQYIDMKLALEMYAE